MLFVLGRGPNLLAMQMSWEEYLESQDFVVFHIVDLTLFLERFGRAPARAYPNCNGTLHALGHFERKRGRR